MQMRVKVPWGQMERSSLLLYKNSSRRFYALSVGLWVELLYMVCVYDLDIVRLLSTLQWHLYDTFGTRSKFRNAVSARQS
jgi:hypothetical protein